MGLSGPLIFGANLMLFRPSLPWCFSNRELPFEQKESQEQQQQEDKLAKIILSKIFVRYIRQFLGRNFDVFRPSQQEQQQQEVTGGKSSQNNPFLWVAEVTFRQSLGAILMLFRPSLPWCFPIREVPFEQKES